MPKKSPDGSDSKEILQLLDIGSTEDGENIMFSLQYVEDRKIEWFNFHHSTAGKIISGLMFGASVAKQHRPQTSSMGNKLPEFSNVIDTVSFNVLSIPGESFVCLRLSLSKDVHLDFRIPKERVPAMKEKLAQAMEVLQSGKSPSAH